MYEYGAVPPLTVAANCTTKGTLPDVEFAVADAANTVALALGDRGDLAADATTGDSALRKVNTERKANLLR